MKKKFLLVAALTAISFGSAFSQTLPAGMEILTPEGVTMTTNSLRAYDKDKPITVAGSKESGYKIYFTARDDAHGEELWVSDGTAAGTKMVKDIYPGATTSNPSYITRFNDKVVFQAIGNDLNGSQLWISDGTEEGTQMVVLLNDISAADPKGFTQLDETRFVFAAMNTDSAFEGDNGQYWLFISDGTAEGTKVLKECNVIYPGQSSNNDRVHFTRVGRKVFFKADSKEAMYGEEVWVTDGTEEGTFMLTDINKTIANEKTGATGGSNADWFTNFKNEKLFFCAYSDEYGNEPWVSDGTTEGTYMLADMTEGNEDTGLPRGHGAFTTAVYGNHVYFRGYHPQYGLELFRTDLTNGVEFVADLNKVPTETGTANGSPDIFCEFDGVLFMKAQSGANTAYDFSRGLELFYSDGTAEGTKMQSDLNPGVGPNAAWEGIVISGSFYFRAQNQTPSGSQTWELFRINNKDEFPVQVVDLADGVDFVHSIRNMNGDVYFTSQAVQRLIKYNYRKPGYDPAVDTEPMDPDFGPGGSGISSVKPENNLVLYPNPARNVVTISTSESITGCTISDLTGRTVLNQIGNQKTISVSNLAKGTYILSVQSEKGRMDSKLIIE